VQRAHLRAAYALYLRAAYALYVRVTV